MTAGGRFRGSRAHPTVLPGRTPAASAPIELVCLTDHFDGESTIPGYLIYNGGDDTSAGSIGDLTLFGQDGGTNKKALLRAEIDAGFASMRVGATLSRIDDGSLLDLQLFGVMARMKELPGDSADYIAGNLVGWLFYVSFDGSDWFAGLDFAYYNEDFSAFSTFDARASFQSATFSLGDPLDAPPAEGDSYDITVTGTGADTRVVCRLAGATLLDVAGNDLAQMNFYPGSGDPSDLYNLWSMDSNATGQRGGVLLQAHSTATWVQATHNGLMGVDDFEVCPA